MLFLPWLKVHRLLLTDFRFVGLSPNAKLVYFQLLLSVDSSGLVRSGESKDTLAVIARVTGISATAVSKAIGQLKTASLLVPEGNAFRVVSTSDLYEASDSGYINEPSNAAPSEPTEDETPKERRRRLNAEYKRNSRNKSADTSAGQSASVSTPDADRSAKNVSNSNADQNADKSSSKEKKRSEEDNSKDKKNKEIEKKASSENTASEPQNEQSFSLPDQKLDQNSSTEQADSNKTLAPVEEKNSSDKSKTDPRVVQVFDHWRKTLDHPKAVLDPQRKRIIEKALKSHGLEVCLAAIDGVSKSPFNMGKNEFNKKYDQIDLIFRNAENIEKYAGVTTETIQGETQSSMNFDEPHNDIARRI